MLPEGLVGKGLGNRAFLHALKSGFVMHDSSYSCPIELRGSRQSLQQLLSQVRCHISCHALVTTDALKHLTHKCRLLTHSLHIFVPLSTAPHCSNCE